LISENAQDSTLLIGCSGWNYPDTPDKGGGWTDVFYPDKETKRLRYYSQFFETAEMDSTFYNRFYSKTTKGTFIGMTKATPERFQFSIKVPENVQNVIYGVLIDADSNRATGRDGVDYQVEMQWNNRTKTWIRFFTEYSTQGQPRVLNEDLNYSKPFFSNGSNYILLHTNLADITSPTRYRIAFYSEIIHNISDSVIDYTNWVDIPPIQYAISTTPENPVTLRQGETKDIGITLKSTSGPVPVLNYLLENHSAINLEINRLKPSQSFEPTELKIGASSNAPTGQYVIPVRANISVESPFPSSFLNLKILLFERRR